jgi:hypothetical protein
MLVNVSTRQEVLVDTVDNKVKNGQLFENVCDSAEDVLLQAINLADSRIHSLLLCDGLRDAFRDTEVRPAPSSDIGDDGSQRGVGTGVEGANACSRVGNDEHKVDMLKDMPVTQLLTAGMIEPF